MAKVAASRNGGLRCYANGSFVRDFGFTGQLQRSVVSIMSNIAEGYEHGSRSEFHHFLTISKASCAEVRSPLSLAHDISYRDTSRFSIAFVSLTCF
jgi:four helix bundle protein